MKKIFLGSIVLAISFLGIRYVKEIKTTPKDATVISPLSKAFKLDTLGATDKKEDFVIYGYLPYWTIAETPNFRVGALTDVAYFGLEINETGNFIKSATDSEGNSTNHSGYWAWRNDPQLTDFIIKARANNVRTSITIVSHVDDVSTKFLNCRECWDSFYEALKEEMAFHKVDNVNLNFEYYELVEKELALKYTEFTAYLRKRLKKDLPNAEIVVAAYADSIINGRITDIESLAKVADRIFIMAYDFHIMPQSKAAPVSPMGGAGIHAGYDIRTMIRDYLSYAPPQKLILGVPYYGFNWSESTEAVNSKEKASDSTEGNEKQENGESGEKDNENLDKVSNTLIQTYAQIMKNVEDSGATVYWDELGQVPYYEYTDPETGKPRKVYFENEKSLEVKYRIAKEFNLAGVGVWALGYDGDRPELWDLLKKEFQR